MGRWELVTRYLEISLYLSTSADGSWLLAQLASTEARQEEAITAGAIDVIIDVLMGVIKSSHPPPPPQPPPPPHLSPLTHHPHDLSTCPPESTVHVYACLALAALCSTAERSEHVQASGAVEAVVSASK